MIVGNRAQSYHRSRCCIPRHNESGRRAKRAANAEEKVEKTRVRREGKAQVRSGLAEG